MKAKIELRPLVLKNKESFQPEKLLVNANDSLGNPVPLELLDCLVKLISRARVFIRSQLILLILFLINILKKNICHGSFVIVGFSGIKEVNSSIELTSFLHNGVKLVVDSLW